MDLATFIIITKCFDRILRLYTVSSCFLWYWRILRIRAIMKYNRGAYLTISPSVTSVIGSSVSLKVGELSTTRVSMSPTIVTFSFFTETVFSVIVTSASGAVTTTS